MMCGNEMTFEMCICMIQHLLHEAINENLYHMENNYLLLRKLLNWLRERRCVQNPTKEKIDNCTQKAT